MLNSLFELWLEINGTGFLIHDFCSYKSLEIGKFVRDFPSNSICSKDFYPLHGFSYDGPFHYRNAIFMSHPVFSCQNIDMIYSYDLEVLKQISIHCNQSGADLLM